jgi:hypothetical protein
MTAEEAELKTNLEAREIKEITNPEHNQSKTLVKLGNNFRCQLGRKFRETGSVKVRYVDPRDGKHHELTEGFVGDFFQLVSYGPTWERAVAMLNERMAAFESKPAVVAEAA